MLVVYHIVCRIVWMSRSRRVRKFNDIGCKWIPRACVGVCDSSRHGRRRAPAQLYSPYIILGPNSVDGRGSRLTAGSLWSGQSVECRPDARVAGGRQIPILFPSGAVVRCSLPARRPPRCRSGERTMETRHICP